MKKLQKMSKQIKIKVEQLKEGDVVLFKKNQVILSITEKSSTEDLIPFEIPVVNAGSNSPKMKRAKGAELGRLIVTFIEANYSKYLTHE